MNNCIIHNLQSPISLCMKHSLNLSDNIINKKYGHNCNSKYDKIHKIYIVSDDIYLKFNHKKYKLYEYHFHTPGEHKIDGKIYPGEIHYVYLKYDHNYSNKYTNVIDICGNKKNRYRRYISYRIWNKE